eukprot:TRINITY_DN14509_c0_g1_i1.p1 TRINITY_DN14509_c0_g1~~TRINITY_DN14509_c0_g1_i1.p1  ORF type:complete len:392 (+),score=106.63 TRINITY_DN14509_c0_g1_i1:45-1220(+)
MMARASLCFALLELRSVAAAHSAPKVMSPPRWGWDAVGSMAFLHGSTTKPLTPEELAMVGKFPLVQFDKKEFIETMPDAATEDRAAAGAAQIKAAYPGTKAVMYINGLIDFPASRLRNVTSAHPHLRAKNADGGRVLIKGNPVYDVRQEAMRRAFVADALEGMSTGVFDGVFIDRANWAASSRCPHAPSWDAATCQEFIPAQRQLFADLTAALGEGNITLAKEAAGTPALDWQVANAAMTSDSFCSMYCHGCNESVSVASLWTAADAETCAASLATIAGMAARGQLSESHAMGPFTGPHADEGRLFTLAAFLMAAGPLSYYSYANWAHSSWDLPGTAWWPEYDRPLGLPLTPPNMRVHGEKWQYTRRFSSGTNITVDLLNRRVDVTWGTAQ